MGSDMTRGLKGQAPELPLMHTPPGVATAVERPIDATRDKTPITP